MSESTPRPAIAVALRDDLYQRVIDPSTREKLQDTYDLLPPTACLEDIPLEDRLRVRALITGWGTPALGPHALGGLPRLGLIAHAAGSVRPVVTADVWERGIRVVSAAAANAQPVADFVTSQIQLTAKDVWRAVLIGAREPGIAVARDQLRVHGARGLTVGILGLGLIGQRVLPAVQAMAMDVVAYDPCPDEDFVAKHDVQLVPLDVAMRRDVVSVHVPVLPETNRLIGARALSEMPRDATLISTAGGPVLDLDALTDVLARRPDLLALVDVTAPEPLPVSHPLLSMPNAVITPHLAGSLGTELAGLGAQVADEILAWTIGAPLRHEINREGLARRS